MKKYILTGDTIMKDGHTMFKEDIIKELNRMDRKLKPKKIICVVQPCHSATFHGIDCLEQEDKYGFEGYYMGDVNHPDPRPGHAIWINKKDAEKLWMIFKDKVLEGVQY